MNAFLEQALVTLAIGAALLYLALSVQRFARKFRSTEGSGGCAGDCDCPSGVSSRTGGATLAGISVLDSRETGRDRSLGGAATQRRKK